MQVNLAVTHFPPRNCLIEMYKMAVFFFSFVVVFFNHRNVFDL